MKFKDFNGEVKTTVTIGEVTVSLTDMEITNVCASNQYSKRGIGTHYVIAEIIEDLEKIQKYLEGDKK